MENRRINCQIFFQQSKEVPGNGANLMNRRCAEQVQSNNYQAQELG
jgi:hypothetical protein